MYRCNLNTVLLLYSAGDAFFDLFLYGIGQWSCVWPHLMDLDVRAFSMAKVLRTCAIRPLTQSQTGRSFRIWPDRCHDSMKASGWQGQSLTGYPTRKGKDRSEGTTTEPCPLRVSSRCDTPDPFQSPNHRNWCPHVVILESKHSTS